MMARNDDDDDDDDDGGCPGAMFYSKHALHDILSASYALLVIMLMMTI